MKSLEQIREIKNAVEGDILKIQGVTGVDIGSREIGEKNKEEPVIIVYVADKEEALKKGKVPREIQGVPVYIEERRFVLHSEKKADN